MKAKEAQAAEEGKRKAVQFEGRLQKPDRPPTEARAAGAANLDKPALHAAVLGLFRDGRL